MSLFGKTTTPSTSAPCKVNDCSDAAKTSRQMKLYAFEKVIVLVTQRVQYKDIFPIVSHAIQLNLFIKYSC